MCGLAGFFNAKIAPQTRLPLLEAMASSIAHRGPDESGAILVDEAGLAHTRLSIVGLGDGQQPMQTPDGDLSIVFNGEIFNYVELRDELKARGYVFRTGSDTEVILHLYRAYGDDCLSRMNGDFAFALFDRRRQRLLLARDRMGVRPLFWTRTADGGLFFGSEIKALLQVPGIEAGLDAIALDQIFTFWAPIAPRTAFEGIFELEPAQCLAMQGHQISTWTYWSLDYPTEPAAPPREAELQEELASLLGDAVRLRMRADVAVGAYLSGGLDSSLICALAAPMAQQGLNTFSVAFDSTEHDESAFQKQVADCLGTQHRSIRCGADDIGDAFSDVIRFTERPILRTAPAPLYRLAGKVREAGMKVVLTGEGADEIFGGYDIFKEARVRRFCARQPMSRFRPHLFRKLYPYLPGLKQQSTGYLAAFFGISHDDISDPLFSHRPRMRSTSGAKIFYSEALRERLNGYDAAEELASRLPAEFQAWHPLNQAQYLETRFLLPGYILSSQGDRMAMAHGVEGRFPFLDHRVVAFACRLPTELKLRGLREKHILREVAKGLLPPEIENRPKQPYRAPDSQAFQSGSARKEADALLSEERLRQTNLFDGKAVRALMHKSNTRPLTGFRDNAAFIGILSSQMWVQQFTAFPKAGRG